MTEMEKMHTGDLYLPMGEEIMRPISERDKKYYFKDREIKF